MARVSFTVRSTGAASGSYLRGVRDTAGGQDEDTALRQDRLVLAPQVFETVVAFMEANCSEYGTVFVQWGGFPPTTLPLTPSPQVTATVLVYSPLGPPQTLVNGTVLAEVSILGIGSAILSFSHPNVRTGHWAYYSLFAHYQSNAGDSYYERLASVEVLPPVDYGSTELLYERVPAYYRDSDIAGSLHQFMSIFGFDMDRMRTVLDFLMTANDPALSEVETLQALADQMASLLNGTDLGTIRLRKLMNDIGFFTRSKGTPVSLQFWSKALTDSDMLIDPVTHTIVLFSERVNYATNPKTGVGIINTRAAAPAEADLDFATAFNNTAFSSTHPYAPSTVSASGGYTFGASPGIQYVMVRVLSPIPIHTGDHVALSVHSGIGTDDMLWARLVTGDGLIVGASEVPIKTDGVRAFDVEVKTGTI